MPFGVFYCLVHETKTGKPVNSAKNWKIIFDQKEFIANKQKMINKIEKMYNVTLSLFSSDRYMYKI